MQWSDDTAIITLRKRAIEELSSFVSEKLRAHTEAMYETSADMPEEPPEEFYITHTQYAIAACFLVHHLQDDSDRALSLFKKITQAIKKKEKELDNGGGGGGSGDIH